MMEYRQMESNNLSFVYIEDITDKFQGVSRTSTTRLTRNFKLNEIVYKSFKHYTIIPTEKFGMNTEDLKVIADKLFPDGNYICDIKPKDKCWYNSTADIYELTEEENDYTPKEIEELKQINTVNTINGLLGNELNEIFEKYGLIRNKDMGVYFKAGMLDKFIKNTLENTLIKELNEIGIDIHVPNSKRHGYLNKVLDLNEMKLIKQTT